MIFASTYYGLQAYGGRVLKSDEYDDHRFHENNVCLKLGDDIESVEAGFLERIEHLTELRVSPSTKEIGVTPALENLMHRNNLLIRGTFDTYAEEFAKLHRLFFLHSDVEICSTGNYFTDQGVNILTLKLSPDKAQLHQDCRCQGSSAGSVGGGEITVDIPTNFYTDPNAVEIVVKNSWGCFAEHIRKSDTLKSFVENARNRGHYIKY